MNAFNACLADDADQHIRYYDHLKYKGFCGNEQQCSQGDLLKLEKCENKQQNSLDANDNCIGSEPLGDTEVDKRDGKQYEKQYIHFTGSADKSLIVRG